MAVVTSVRIRKAPFGSADRIAPLLLTGGLGIKPPGVGLVLRFSKDATGWAPCGQTAQNPSAVLVGLTVTLVAYAGATGSPQFDPGKFTMLAVVEGFTDGMSLQGFTVVRVIPGPDGGALS